MRSSVALLVLLAPAVAAAQPRSASIDVAPSCAGVVDPAAVVIALRVELAAAGVTTVVIGDRGDVPVAIECPSPADLVIASGRQRSAIALAEVAPDARSRVLALVVADWLRPATAPELRASQPRWEVLARTRGVLSSDTAGGVIGGGLARRFGPWRVEAEIGLVAGSNNHGALAGVTAEGRLACEPLRVGRAWFGLAAGALFASVVDRELTSSGLALLGELRSRIALSARWSVLVSLGGGRDADHRPFALAGVGLARPLIGR